MKTYIPNTDKPEQPMEIDYIPNTNEYKIGDKYFTRERMQEQYRKIHYTRDEAVKIGKKIVLERELFEKRVKELDDLWTR